MNSTLGHQTANSDVHLDQALLLDLSATAGEGNKTFKMAFDVNYNDPNPPILAVYCCVSFP